MARLRSIGWLRFVCAALLLLATTLYLVVLAFTGRDLIELGGLPGSPVERVIDQRDGLPITLAALAAALLTLGLWARDRRQAEDASGLDRELAARSTTRSWRRCGPTEARLSATARSSSPTT